MDMPMNYHVWGAMLERYQIHVKANQNAKLKNASLHW